MECHQRSFWSKLYQRQTAKTPKNIKYSTEVLTSSLCDFNDAYVLLTGDVTVAAGPVTEVAFKNCAPFTKFITEIDGITVNTAGHLYLVMPITFVRIQF